MLLFRPCRTFLVPTVLTVVGAFTLGTINSSQALETAQVSPASANPDSASPNSESLRASEPEASSDKPAANNLEQSSAEDKAAPLVLARPNEDSLLPGKVNGRDLTSQEQDRLRLGLERLNMEAEAAYVRGDRPAAYRKFFRVLSLSQYLPAQEELSGLTHIGRRAWQDSLGEEAQVMAARVRQLEADAGEKLSPARRQSLAEAYESLGAWDYAIAHYETLLAMEQPRGEKGAAEGREASVAVTPTDSPVSTLNETTLVHRLARLSLFRLDYGSAALYTEQALSQNPDTTRLTPDLSNRSDGASATNFPDILRLPLPSEIAPAQTETELLTQLAYIYEQDQRFAEAASVQQQIFPLYNDPFWVSQQPALQVAIAQNQARAGQLVEAIASYQAAYGQSQTLQQFAVSNAALSQLAALYRSQGQLSDALSVYDVLIEVNELSYNLYGIADTQAHRAEIFTAQQQLEQASLAYRQALYAAKLLGYREAELQQRLDALTLP